MAHVNDPMAELALEFIDLTSDSLREIECHLAALAAATPPEREKSLKAIRRVTHTLKGNGGSFGYPNISLIAHEIEDFLVHADAWATPTQIGCFFDRIDDVLHGRLPADGDAKVVINGLPRASCLFAPERHKFTVVLVIEEGTQAHLVRRELEMCGYSVILIPRTIEAFDYIHRVTPNLVLASAVMPGLTGVELVLALKALPATRSILCALLTTLDRTCHDFQDLPAEIPLIRKGQAFFEDFAKLLVPLRVS